VVRQVLLAVDVSFRSRLHGMSEVDCTAEELAAQEPLVGRRWLGISAPTLYRWIPATGNAKAPAT
jgi:hypothetical protein